MITSAENGVAAIYHYFFILPEEISRFARNYAGQRCLLRVFRIAYIIY